MGGRLEDEKKPFFIFACRYIYIYIYIYVAGFFFSVRST